MKKLISIFLFFIFLSEVCFTQVTTSPSLILYNGRVWTGDDKNEFVEAVAIKDNLIFKTGTSALIKKLAGPGTVLVDLEGKLVTPGINDAHTHFLSGSMGLNEIDLNNCKTLEEAKTVIATYCKNHPDKRWIKGMGWLYSLFPGGMPHRSILDSLVNDKPVFLSAYDGHSAWVNSKALKLAGITRDTKYDGFGEVVKDANGEPTGALTEGAQSLVRKLIPEPTTEDKLNALRTGMKYAASLGITSIQNASGSPEEFALYETLLKNGELTLRSRTAFSVSKNTSDAEIKKLIIIKDRYKNHPILQAGSVKFMLDGVIESHTAVMLKPYSDVPPNSKLANSEFALPIERYESLVSKFDKAGFQVYTHAIGDHSVRVALNAYEKARQLNKTTNRRHRIEHIEQSSPEDIPRFAKLGVIASMEPIHADPGTNGVWLKAVGKEREPYSFVWASMLQQKVKLVFSSDWPACISPDPLRGLHNAVNRQTIEGQPPGGWLPEQRVSIRETLKAYTQAGAYSSFEENIKGKIVPGHLADIIVFSQDLFMIPPADIYKSKIVLTIFDGKIIYRQ